MGLKLTKFTLNGMNIYKEVTEICIICIIGKSLVEVAQYMSQSLGFA